MSKRHKRKNNNQPHKKRCVLCGEVLYPFENDYIIGSTGRVVCRDCLGIAETILNGRKTDEAKKSASLADGIMPPQEIIRKLDTVIIGQEQAKHAVSVALWKQLLRAAGVASVPRSNLLLYGPTGCGKTALVREAANIVGLPFLTFDSTTLTEAGYRGRDASDMVDDLMSRFPNHPKRNHGVLFLDEFDKLAAKGSDVRIQYNRGTQHSLLKLVEGIEVKQEHGFFSTDSLLFIFGGAFTGLGMQAKQQVNPIGFLCEVKSPVIYSAPTISTESFVAFGMEAELMGRVGQYIPLSPLTGDVLEEILLHSPLSLFRQYQHFFAGYGIRLEISASCTKQLVQAALTLGTGARGLNHLVEEAVEPLLFRLAVGNLPQTVQLENRRVRHVG